MSATPTSQPDRRRPAPGRRPSRDRRPSSRAGLARRRRRGRRRPPRAPSACACSSRSRRLLGDLLRAVPAAGPAAGRRGAAGERRPAVACPRLVQVGIDSGIPPLLAGGSAAHAAARSLGVLLGAVVLQAVSRVVVPAGLRPGRPGGPAGAAPPGVRTTSSGSTSPSTTATPPAASSRRLTTDIEAIAELLSDGFDGLVTAVLTMVGAAVLLLVLDLKLGLVCLICFPVLLLLVRWFRGASASTYRRVRETVGAGDRALRGDDDRHPRGPGATAASRATRRSSRTSADQLPRTPTSESFRLVAVFMPGRQAGRQPHHRRGRCSTAAGWRSTGEMTVGVLAAFLLYLRMFFEPMQEISQFYNTFQSASAALEKLSGVLEEEPAVAEPRAPGRRCRTPAARWCFDGVGFGYVAGPAGAAGAGPGRPGRADRGAGRHHRGGQDDDRQADGPLLRPRPPGAVTLDGVDLRELDDADAAPAVVMVTQENFMFDGTVADNILFGRPGAGRDRGRGGGRARSARTTFIAALPAGLRHRRRQARRAAVGRAAPAGGVRPGVPRRPGGADPGRGDLEPGRARASGWCSRRCARSSPTGRR